MEKLETEGKRRKLKKGNVKANQNKKLTPNGNNEVVTVPLSDIKQKTKSQNETPTLKPKVPANKVVGSILAALAAGVSVGVPAVIYYNNRELEISIESQADNFVAYKLEIRRGTKIGNLKSKLDVFDGHTLVGIYKDPEYQLPYQDSEILKKDSSVYLKYEKWTYSVNLPGNSDYYEISHTDHEDLNAVNWGETFTFTLKIKDQWTDSLDESKICVTANGKEMRVVNIFGNEIVYGYDHLDADLDIEIVVDSYEIVLPTSTEGKYTIEYNSDLDLKNIKHGEEFEFRIRLGDRYKIKEGETLLDVKLSYSLSEHADLVPVSQEDGLFVYKLEPATRNVAIIIDEKRIVVKNFLVDFSKDENYNIGYHAEFDNNLIEWGNSFKFKVTVDDAWKTSGLKVFANSQELTVDQDGYYTILDIKSDVQIKVENIERKVFEASFASTSVYQVYVVDDNKNEIETPKLYWNDSLNIKVVLAAGYEVGLSNINLTGDALLDESAMAVTKNADGSHSIYCKITEIKESIFIEVTHPSINEYCVMFPQNPLGYNINVIQGETVHGSTFKFTVDIDEGYSESTNVVVSVVSVSTDQLIELEQVEDVFIFTVEEDVIIRVENVKINKYSVIIPSSKYYTIERDILSDVDHGTENFKFKLVFNEAYTQNYGIDIIEKNNLVKINYDDVTQYYTVEGAITEDLEFIIDDITINTYKLTLPMDRTGYSIVTDEEFIPNILKHGETFSFKIQLDESYSQSLDNVVVYLNGSELALNTNGYYVIESAVEDVEILIEGVDINKYTITWADGSGDWLLIQTVNHGEVPVYENENPIKKETYSHTYEFTGWDSEIIPATKDVTYTAIFTEIEKEKYSLESLTENVVIESTSRGGGAVKLQSTDNVYQGEELIIGYLESDGYVMSEFTINGDAVGEGETYSLTLEDEFEIEYAEVESYGLTFKINMMKDGYLVGKYNAIPLDEDGDLNIIVPSKVYNLPVYAIEQGAFSGNVYLKSIKLPKSISSIGVFSFYNCSNLNEVVFESGDKSLQIGASAFADCSSLTSILIPSNTKNILNGAFKGCYNLTEVTIDSVSICSNLISDVHGSNLLDYATKVRISEFIDNESELYDVVSYRYIRSIESFYRVYNQKKTSVLSLNSENINASILRNGEYEQLFNDSIVYSGETVMLTYSNSDGYEMSEFTINGSPCDSLMTSVLVEGDIDVVYKAISTAFSWVKSPEGYTITSYDNSFGETDVTVPSKIKNANVKDIASSAFAGCTMTGIVLPTNLFTIGSNAFKGCAKLQSVILPVSIFDIGEYAFSGCTSLEEASFLNQGVNAVDVGTYLFNGCTSLKSIQLPKISVIPEGMFKNCSSLSSVSLYSSTTEIGASAFNGCSSLSSIILPDSVKTIGGSAFASSGLTSIIIPAGIQTVGSLVFASCTKLTSAKFSATTSTTITTMGSSVFSGCSALTSVTLPTTLTSISPYIFDDCSSLESISLPLSVKTINKYAFRKCKALTTINLNYVTTISDSAFNYCSSLETVNISNVTTLGDSVFDECTGLTRVEDAYLLREIGDYAFRKCASLTTVQSLNKLTTIGSYAFYGCIALNNFYIGPLVTSIGVSAFYGCSSLIKVAIDSEYVFQKATSRISCGGLLEYADTVGILRDVYTKHSNSFLKGLETPIMNDGERFWLSLPEQEEFNPPSLG